MIEGKRIKGIDDTKWEIEAPKIMLEACYQKFFQSSVLKDKLLSTDGRLLAEASMNMTWGVGQHIRDIDLGDKNKQLGQNKLGEILMKVRDTLLNHDKN